MKLDLPPKYQQEIKKLLMERLELCKSISKEKLDVGAAYYLLGAASELIYLLELVN